MYDNLLFYRERLVRIQTGLEDDTEAPKIISRLLLQDHPVAHRVIDSPAVESDYLSKGPALDQAMRTVHQTLHRDLLEGQFDTELNLQYLDTSARPQDITTRLTLFRPMRTTRETGRQLAVGSLDMEDSIAEWESVELIDISEAEMDCAGVGLKTSSSLLSLEESSAMEDAGCRVPRLLPTPLSDHAWEGDPWQLVAMAQSIQNTTRVSINCSKCMGSVHLIARGGRWLPGAFTDYGLLIPDEAAPIPAAIASRLADLHAHMQSETVLHPVLDPQCRELWNEIDELARSTPAVRQWLTEVTALALLQVCAHGSIDDGVTTSVVPEGLSSFTEGYRPIELMMWAGQAASVSAPGDAAWRFRQAMNALQVPTWNYLIVKGRPWLIGSTQTALPDWAQSRAMADLLLDLQGNFKAMGYGEEHAMANTLIHPTDVLHVVATDRYATFARAQPRMLGVILAAAQTAMREVKELGEERVKETA